MQFATTKIRECTSAPGHEVKMLAETWSYHVQLSNTSFFSSISHASAMHLYQGSPFNWCQRSAGGRDSQGHWIKGSTPGRATGWNGVASVASPTGDGRRQLTIASCNLTGWEKIIYLSEKWECSCGVIGSGSEAMVERVQCVPIPGWTCIL